MPSLGASFMKALVGRWAGRSQASGALFIGFLAQGARGKAVCTGAHAVHCTTPPGCTAGGVEYGGPAWVTRGSPKGQGGERTDRVLDLLSKPHGDLVCARSAGTEAGAGARWASAHP